MERKKLFKIKFKSFIALCLSIAAPLGLAFGALSLIGSLIGGSAYSNLFIYHLQGITAGIANLILAPLLFSFIGLIVGILSYFPFKFYLKVKRGIVIEGAWGETNTTQKSSQENTAPLRRL